jgi:hypothetical protein
VTPCWLPIRRAWCPDTAAEGFRPWCVRDCANRYGRCGQLSPLLTTEGAGNSGSEWLGLLDSHDSGASPGNRVEVRVLFRTIQIRRRFGRLLFTSELTPAPAGKVIPPPSGGSAFPTHHDSVTEPFQVPKSFLARERARSRSPGPVSSHRRSSGRCGRDATPKDDMHRHEPLTVRATSSALS